MHAKAIAGSHKRTGVDTVKVMVDLIDAAFVTSDGGPILTCKYAKLQAEAQTLRYTLDGSTPSASAGFVLPANSFVTLAPAELRSIKVIGIVAGGFANTALFSA